MQTILAIDDEASVLASYQILLSSQHRLICASDGPSGLKVLDEKHVDLILLDLTMPGMSGLDFLTQLHVRGETAPVIIVTGSNSVEMAVKTIKQGAREFVIKPFDVEDLLFLVDRTLSEVREKRELKELREQGKAGFDHIIGDSPALMGALAQARRAMQVNSTVLITGETGTGKDVVARAIHYGSPRSLKPFVPLSCCAIPPNLVESELFGHVRGAFTGATENRVGKMQVADGGTLFLDEIGEMPVEAQARLLRVLQDGCFYPVGGVKLIEVDVRFICATNRDFTKAIEGNQFREDLFYRINVLPIELPPLRQRREDIPKLVAHFMAKHGPRVNARLTRFSPRAMACLMAYHWPGNVRELENTIERILVCCGGERILQAEDLEGIIPRAKALSGVAGNRNSDGFFEDLEGLPLHEATQRIERYLILHALERCGYVQSQAAEMLGTTRRILKYKMDQLGIQENPGQKPESAAS